MEDFPNIPTDVQRQVLLRVPYTLHDELKVVCTRWKEMMCSPKFYEDRKTYGTSQRLICLIPSSTSNLFHHGITVYDPVEGTWERTPTIPWDSPFLDTWEFSVNGKLVLFGQSLIEIEMGLRRSVVVVFIYDFASRKWRRVSNMPTTRMMFASAVSPSKGLIYAAGGQDEQGNSLATAEAYDVEEDRWEILPPMSQNLHRSVGVYLEGKFMVISGRSAVFYMVINGDHISSAQVFDEETGSWQTLENMWTLPTPITEGCRVVCTCGNLYRIVHVSKKVMKFGAQKNVWTSVASVPQNIDFIFCAAAWGDQIFVSGATEKKNPIAYFFQQSTGQWKVIDSWQEFGGYSYVSAVTFDI